MAISLVDTAVPMNDTGYPVARAKHIWLDNDTNLQKAIDDGLIGGGGDSSVTLTQQEYEALSEEQKLNGLYYTYDTKRIYKNGVQYGASDAEGIGYNNAESGIQATTVQGAIDKVVKTVEDTYAKTTDIPTTLPANGGNADTVNNHTVKSDVPENAVFTDTVYDDTEVKAEIAKKADKNAVLNSLEIKNGYTTAQIIPWSDGTHYRSFEDKSSNTYTDIVTNNGIALIARTENGKQTKSAEIATMDKVEWKQLTLPTPIIDGKTRTYSIDLSVYKEIAIQTWINEWETNIDFRVVPLMESEMGYVVSYTNGTSYMTYRIAYNKSKIKIDIEAENMASQNYPLLSLLLAR